MLTNSKALARTIPAIRATIQPQVRFQSTSETVLGLGQRLKSIFSSEDGPKKMPELVQYRIFKYDPQVDNEPYIQSWYLEYSKNSPMLLDDLFRIKNTKDEGLAFRRSCREGICGSCAMNVNGKNALACTYKVGDHISDVKPYISVYPLPHMPIVKDLAVDMKHFYMQYKSIDPYLKEVNVLDSFIKDRINPKPGFKHDRRLSKFHFTLKPHKKENLQSKKNRALIDGLYECILCACCSTSCPSYWWNRDKYLGPAVLLQAYRWVVDSRDRALKERLDYLNDVYRLYRCHTILNCIKCCPKSLSPAEAISNIKSMISLT
ncbi:succinate dehydrogenase (ubiquinone) iron-sulfur subunit [Acrasis kona]|uniref:Succinate dehydrogenase [ubiquinone] iron-sulfur subunit, mitochondrial n=1 Tax=Acrasis kona TaxID=1008807 RepID=A0AAW2YUB3_9EUKA